MSCFGGAHFGETKRRTAILEARPTKTHPCLDNGQYRQGIGYRTLSGLQVGRPDRFLVDTLSRMNALFLFIRFGTRPGAVGCWFLKKCFGLVFLSLHLALQKEAAHVIGHWADAFVSLRLFQQLGTRPGALQLMWLWLSNPMGSHFGWQVHHPFLVGIGMFTAGTGF